MKAQRESASAIWKTGTWRQLDVFKGVVPPASINFDSSKFHISANWCHIFRTLDRMTGLKNGLRLFVVSKYEQSVRCYCRATVEVMSTLGWGWRAPPPLLPSCIYLRVNYSVVCPADKLKPRLGSKVTFGLRFTWGRVCSLPQHAVGSIWGTVREQDSTGSWWIAGFRMVLYFLTPCGGTGYNCPLCSCVQSRTHTHTHT